MPPTFLFGNEQIATATSGRSTYAHTFGGPHDRQGTSREDCGGILIHLLLRLDLSDPAVPFSIPGLRWLPLYYCFDFRANELGYQLLSDDELVTFFPEDDPHVTEDEEWPADNYPLEFPECPIQVETYDYDPTNREDAYQWAGVFGIGKLSQRDQTMVKKHITKCMRGMGLDVPTTDEEFAETLSLPFAQAKPQSPCLNPACDNHAQPGALTPIAVMPAEPVESVQTFGPYGGGVQLIFEYCSSCRSVRVSNQST